MLFGLTIEIEKKEDIEVTVCDEYEPCACGHKGEYGDEFGHCMFCLESKALHDDFLALVKKHKLDKR